MTVREARLAFQRHQEESNLAASTRAGYRSLLRRLEGAAAGDGVERLEGLDAEWIRRWRGRWSAAASTQQRMLAQLARFFRHAVREGWVAASPLEGVARPKVRRRPKEPLRAGEVRALVEAAAARPRERALLLLMRWSGLSIQDAVCLPRSALTDDGCLVLRRVKTDSLVTVPLPRCVRRALRGIADPEREHWFWTGEGQPSTCAKYWRGRLAGVAKAAGVEGFHPHRLRHTYAVGLLAAGVAMDDVSQLLGHGSVKTTESYYAAWDRSRRDRLRRVVDDALAKDELLRRLEGAEGEENPRGGGNRPRGKPLDTNHRQAACPQDSTCG